MRTLRMSCLPETFLVFSDYQVSAQFSKELLFVCFSCSRKTTPKQYIYIHRVLEEDVYGFSTS